MNPDALPKPPTPEATPAPEQTLSPVQPERTSSDLRGSGSNDFFPPIGEPLHVPPPDPAWNAWDVLRLVLMVIVSLFVGLLIALLIAHLWFYPHAHLAELARMPLIAVAGQSLAYVLIFAYMYVLVTRERRRPDFLAAIHWNFPSNIAVYVLSGFVLSLGLQAFSHFLPIPKELPIDTFFRTPAEAWALGILSITLAPVMEELFFRGFLYPVLARSLGLPIAVFLTAFAFALLHGAQLGFSWGPVLVIFLVGLVLTIVRARKNSVAAGVLIHMAYNGTITVAMFAATDGFRHLEKLNQ
ncbi:MAG: CPBP family intramembrane glutamic endopeptidase [Terriglobales bacterium]